MDDRATKAQRLKDEGNALFTKKKYKAAAAKYSAAIELSPDNAVLWSNRSACSLHMGSYLEAATDAEKATELDPSFSRGWARLATAHQQISSWSPAIEAWKHALSALPKTDLSQGEQRQKAEYEEMLEDAERALEETQRNLEEMRIANSVNGQEGGTMPWERVEGMKDELLATVPPGAFSSAWLILSAYNEWKEGMKIMSRLRKHTMKGQLAITGETGAIERLSNAIIRDKRVFRVVDPQFMSRYNDQMMYEVQTLHAWTKGGADLIIRQAQRRLSSTNWASVRPALSLTVRSYILRAFFMASLMKDNAAAVALYNDAIDIVERGKVLWAEVSAADKGIIFSKTFTRGVKALRLESFMNAYKEGIKGFPLKKLAQRSEELLGEIVNDEPDPDWDALSALTFVQKPISEAMAMRALVDMELVQHCKTPEEAQQHLALAAETYTHAGFLNSALQAYWQCATPLRITLPIMEKIKAAVPRMKHIWEHSQLALDGGDKVLQRTLWFEEEVQTLLREGKIKLDDPIVMGGPDEPRQVR